MGNMAISRSYLVASIAVFVCTIELANAQSPQCRNELGEPVDWFYVYKLPREPNHINPLIRNGVAYLHITPDNIGSGWLLSNLSIGDPDSMVGRTLDIIYENSEALFILYNDQPPEPELQEKYESIADLHFFYKHKKDYKKYQLMQKHKEFKMQNEHDFAMNIPGYEESGHTKGVVMGGANEAVWLVHSVPKFPPVPRSGKKYSYPHTGTKYGQTFLCMSIPTPTLNQVGTQLRYNQPMYTDVNVPKVFQSELPHLMDALKNKPVESEPWFNIETFETLKGRRFVSFAKSDQFKDDLYSGLVAQKLESDLVTETWMNGPGTLPSECSLKYQVRNIQSLKFTEANLSFSCHSDHSKWALAASRRQGRHRPKLRDVPDRDHWLCVGDINRARSQESRGGGTVCTSGPVLWGHFANIVQTVQNCS